VLFSEPKIPQFYHIPRWLSSPNCFSALQRAENSSISEPRGSVSTWTGFSALQRAENSSILNPTSPRFASVIGFSALQRAENSSIKAGKRRIAHPPKRFQCSSASRKFLN